MHAHTDTVNAVTNGLCLILADIMKACIYSLGGGVIVEYCQSTLEQDPMYIELGP